MSFKDSKKKNKTKNQKADLDWSQLFKEYKL